MSKKRVPFPEAKRREFIALVTDKKQWLGKDLTMHESVTLEGPTAFLTELGSYHVVLTPVGVQQHSLMLIAELQKERDAEETELIDIIDRLEAGLGG